MSALGTTVTEKGKPATEPSSWKTSLAALATVVAANVAAYGNTFSVPFLYDDQGSILRNQSIRHLLTSFAPPPGATVGGRPVLNLSLALNHAISGTGVWSYHAFNLAVHILTALFLFGIARRMFKGRLPCGPALPALSLALLWSLHPLQTESVTYIVQRAESLMGLFYLMSLYCYASGSEAPDSRRPFWFASSVAACLAGMGTKEVMVSAPLVILLYDRTFISGSFKEAWSRRRGILISLAATWLVLPWLVCSTHGRGGSAGFGTRIAWWDYALTQLPAICHYIRLTAWPSPLVFDYGTALATPGAQLIPCAAFIFLVAAGAVLAAAKRPAIGFPLICFLVILAPSSSFIPVATETMAEHRMYLPLAAILGLAVAAAFSLSGRRAAVPLLLVAALFAWSTRARNQTYRNPESLWADTVLHMPLNPRAHNNLGAIIASDGSRLPEALAQCREAVRLDPNLAYAHNNLGVILEKSEGPGQDSLAEYEAAVRIQPDFVDARVNLGLALSEVPGRSGEALGDCKRAVELDPDSAKAHQGYGSVLSRIPGRTREAVSELETAIRLDPDLAEAQYDLGVALAQIPGRGSEAIAHYQRAVEIRPDLPEAQFNLAAALSRVPGRLGESIAHYEAAIRAKPGYAKARTNLGAALLGIPGRADDAIAQCREAVRLDPGMAEAHNNLGMALANRRGPDDEVVAEFREAVRLKPEFADAQFNLGTALSGISGRTDEAITAFEAAVRLKPSDTGARLALASLYATTPKLHAEAREQLTEVLRIEPGNRDAERLLHTLD